MSRVSFTRVVNAPGVVWTQLYFGLGFTTLATLILELSLTRIFSVVFYYHFAFLAISVATANRRQRLAEAWLSRAVSGG